MTTDSKYIKAVVDWAKWYDTHYKTIPRDNLAKRVDFMEEALGGAIDLFAMHASTRAAELAELDRKSNIIMLPGLGGRLNG